MDPKELMKPLLVTLGAGIGLVILVAVGSWWLKGRQAWQRTMMPVVLAGAFFCGYGSLFLFPKTASAELWQWTAVAAGMMGVIFAAGQLAAGKYSWGMLPMVGAVAWVMTRRISADWAYYMAALGGMLALYWVSFYPAVRDGRLWAMGPGVALVVGFAGTFVLIAWVDARIGKMAMMTTALAGLSLVAGAWRPLRGLANGAGLWLAAMLAVELMAGAYYAPEQLPWWVFGGIGAGALASAVGWMPVLRRRPVVGTVIAVLLALAIVAPVLAGAARHAPAIEG